MVILDLTADERDQLRAMLEEALSDLRMEIADTDRLEFRERLKERKRILMKAIQALAPERP